MLLFILCQKYHSVLYHRVKWVGDTIHVINLQLLPRRAENWNLVIRIWIALQVKMKSTQKLIFVFSPRIPCDVIIVWSAFQIWPEGIPVLPTYPIALWTTWKFCLVLQELNHKNLISLHPAKSRPFYGQKDALVPTSYINVSCETTKMGPQKTGVLIIFAGFCHEWSQMGGICTYSLHI